MRKILLTICLVSLLSPLGIFAQGVPEPPVGDPVVLENPLTADCPPGDEDCGIDNILELAVAIMDAITYIAIPLLIFFIILAGFKFVTAGGNPEKIKEAKRMFLYVLIGAAIILGAQIIARLLCETIAAISGGDLQCNVF